MEDVTKTSVNLSAELYRRVKARCNDRGLKVGEGIAEALELWLSVDVPEPQLASEISAAEEMWLRRVLYVLRSGSFTHATGLQLSIECFEQVVRNLFEEGQTDEAHEKVRNIGELRGRRRSQAEN